MTNIYYILYVPN